MDGLAPTDPPSGFRDARTPGHRGRQPRKKRLPNEPRTQRQTYIQRIQELEEELAEAKSSGFDPVGGELSVMSLLNKNQRRVRKLLDACSRELQDPRDPRHYTLRPHSHELTVTYTVARETASGRTIYTKKVAQLQDLLNQAGITGIEPGDITVKSKVADPRELLLKCVSANHDTVRLLLDCAKALSDAQSLQMAIDAILDVVRTFDKEKAELAARAIARRLNDFAATRDLAGAYVQPEDDEEIIESDFADDDEGSEQD